MFAHPRPALRHQNAGELLRLLERLVFEEGITEVVVGIPLSMSGADSAQTAQARTLAGQLRGRLAVPVSEWDERLSTVEAWRLVGPGKRRTGELDSAAAAVVLQAVLDQRRSHP